MAIDIGDKVSLYMEFRHPVNGALTDPAGVTVTVANPNGVDFPTDPVLNPSTGAYESAVGPVDVPGTWAVTWTAIGPDQVELAYFIVPVAGSARTRPLAGVADLEFRLGRSLTSAELALAPGQLHSASVRIRSFCRQKFTYVPDAAVILRPVGTELRLPQTPVEAVTSVTAVGSNNVPDVTVTGWTFDGIETIDVRGALDTDIWVSLPAAVSDLDVALSTYRVVYTHGWQVIPETLVDICCGAVIRSLTSPTEAAGTTQHTIGQYSEQQQQGMGSAGRTPYLTKADKELLTAEGFRRGDQGTIQLKA